MDYIAFQGYIDERMRRQITLLERNGWQVRVILNYPMSYRVQIEGTEMRVIIPSRIVSNPIFDLLFFNPVFVSLRYFRMFIRGRNQLRLLYVLNFPDSYAIPYLILGRLFHIPTIYEVRDPWKEFFLTESEPSTIGRTRFQQTFSFMALIERIAISLARGVVYANPSIQEVHAYDNRRKPTCIINNYSNYSYGEQLGIQAEQLRRNLGLEDSVVISYIAGNLHPYRGVDSLLEGLSQVVSQNPRIKLMVVGGTEEAVGLIRKKIQTMHLDNNCVLIGWIPGKDLILYYLISDFGIIPHLRTPATELTVPNKLFDYMVLGKPVIMTSLKEQERYVNEGVNGLKVEPDDPKELAQAILELAGDPRLLKTIGEGALEEGKKYGFAELEPIFLDFVARLSKKAES